MNQHLVYKGKLSKLAEALTAAAIIVPTDLGCTMVLSDSCEVPCVVCGRACALLINRYGITRCVGCDAAAEAEEPLLPATLWRASKGTGQPRCVHCGRDYDAHGVSADRAASCGFMDSERHLVCRDADRSDGTEDDEDTEE